MARQISKCISIEYSVAAKTPVWSSTQNAWTYEEAPDDDMLEESATMLQRKASFEDCQNSIFTIVRNDLGGDSVTVRTNNINFTPRTDGYGCGVFYCVGMTCSPQFTYTVSDAFIEQVKTIKHDLDLLKTTVAQLKTDVSRLKALHNT